MFIKRYGSGAESYFGLHGWGGDHKTFAPLAAHVPERASLYCADLPGYGRSPAPRSWEPEAIAEEIASAISGIASPALTLIGNCSGANLSLLAATRAAGKIERMVLIDPFAFMPWYFNVFVATRFGRAAYYSTFANPIGRWVTNLSLKNKRTAGSDLTASFKSVDHEVSYRYLSTLSRIGDAAQFGALGLPIDIVYGERTFGAVKRSIELWQGVWPQARRFELAGAGHLPIVEATAQLSAVIFAPQGRASTSDEGARPSPVR